MFRSTAILRSLLFPLGCALALGLAGCTEKERSSYATELDEPNYREGQALLKSGRKQEALNAFLKVIDKRIDDAPESHLEVGLLYAQHINDPLSAIYHFKKYLALRPNSPQAPLVKQRIDAATREFARTMPAQPLESQLQRVDLVAALDRLKQENESLKQQLADVKAGRFTPATTGTEDNSPATTTPSAAVNFSLETMPVVRTRPPPVSPPRATPAPARTTPAPAQTTTTRPAGARRHTVQPGDTLSKLAQQYYSNRAKWREIYAANRDVMKNEGDLKIGQELRIP